LQEGDFHKKNLEGEKNFYLFAEEMKKRIKYSEIHHTAAVKALLEEYKVNTVCVDSLCPNIYECFSKGSMTFMILGRKCTRRCKFCEIGTTSTTEDETNPIDTEEPRRIAEVVKILKQRFVVITSVTRDDLEDKGARQFCATVKWIKAVVPEVVVELLIPDFGGDERLIEMVALSGATVVGHNVEVVERLYPTVKREADYKRSIGVLKSLRECNKDILTKSGVMLGLGERREEVEKVLFDLREAGVEWVTLGQYLRPNKLCVEVKEYISEEKFRDYEVFAKSLGFKIVQVGSCVRSSYNSAEVYSSFFNNLQQAML